MFTPYIKAENILNQNPFALSEVQFNLFHRVAEGDLDIALKTADNNMIALNNDGFPMWLWIKENTEKEVIANIIDSLSYNLKDKKLSGVAGEPNISSLFAKQYANLLGVENKLSMGMESYCCPKVIKPKNVLGRMIPSETCHTETVARFLAEFMFYYFGEKVTAESQIASAGRLISSGNLYLWKVNDIIVSMANIAHRSPRHARINSVLTPLGERKKGYASALVAEMSELVMKEGLIAMLYADITNQGSNKVYKNIGFIECGRIDQYSFVN